MRRTLGIIVITLGGGLPSTSCVEEECAVIDLELSITNFAEDESRPAGLEFCDPDGGPCVGRGGSISFLPERLDIDGPTQADLHGAATGHWDPNRFFAVGEAGTVISAVGGYDGWTAHAVDTDESLRAVATLHDLPVVVAIGETVAVWSDDAGDTWNTSALPEDMQADHLVHLADDLFLAGGDGGQLWTTPDGQDWTSLSSPTQDDITSLYAAFHGPLLGDSAGRVYSQQEDGAWQELSVPGSAPVISFSGLNLLWALRSDGTTAYRFLDEDWKKGDYVADDGVVMAAGEFEAYYYDSYSIVEFGWMQSVCVVDDDGEIHSASAWVDPVLECRL